MENAIKNNLENPEVLEQLFRKNRKRFEKAFLNIYPEISSNPLAKFWFTRLTAENKMFDVTLKEITYVLISCFIVSIIMLIPWLFGFNPNDNNFYERNLALTALFGVTIYTAILKNINLKKTLAILGFFIISAIYLNVLPKSESSSIILIYLHLPFLLWFTFGIVFSEFDLKNNEKRIEFIKFNGDLAIMFGIFAIAGMILTAFTIGLFSAIGINVEKIYIELIVIPGVVSVPIICTFLINKFDYLSNKIAAIIANIFNPLILITLTIYLISIIAKGNNPFINRDFLIIFNAMLIGVVALIIFSISERTNNSTNNYYTIIFTALSTIALLINVIALLAILYRITEYGITPNRLAVIGSNILFFTHLILILTNLLKVIQKKQNLTIIERVTAKFLPYYVIWLIFVVFILPLIFNFK
jgi:hypothetical protein